MDTEVDIQKGEVPMISRGSNRGIYRYDRTPPLYQVTSLPASCTGFPPMSRETDLVANAHDAAVDGALVGAQDLSELRLGTSRPHVYPFGN